MARERGVKGGNRQFKAFILVILQIIENDLLLELY